MGDCYYCGRADHEGHVIDVNGDRFDFCHRHKDEVLAMVEAVEDDQESGEPVWTDTSEAEEATEDEKATLTKLLNGMREWGAGEVQNLGLSTEGYIVVGYTIISRPTEYVGTIYRQVEDYETGEVRVVVLYVTTPREG